MATDNDVMYTCDEAGKLLKLTADTVRRYCNETNPRIHGRKIGRDWFVPVDEIARYKKDRKNPGRPVASPPVERPAFSRKKRPARKKQAS